MRTTLRLSAFVLGSLLLGSLFFASGSIPAGAAAARPRQAVDQDQFPPGFVPSGKQMYAQYCAACHGSGGKGNGPARAALRVPASDLTTLAKRHGGAFPTDYVTKVLQFGPGVPAHGSYDMPTWGPIFRYLDNFNNATVQKRIQNLCDYLNSLQEK
jgi:mono/diheme cytochrome c family protein